MKDSHDSASAVSPRVSKGRRKRLERRAAEVAAESDETRRAKKLAQRVGDGLYEIRRRAAEEKNPNLDLPIFPFVDGLLAEIRQLWGEAAEREMRPLLEDQATQAVARVFNPALYRKTLRTLARLQGRGGGDGDQRPG